MIWVDRCTMHRGMEFDDQRFAREAPRHRSRTWRRIASRGSSGRRRRHDAGGVAEIALSLDGVVEGAWRPR